MDEQELALLMEEPPGGPGPGQYPSDLMRGGGFIVADPTRPGDIGMTAHRGVLHPDEYVDFFVLRDMIERELGFTYEEISSVYRQGPLSSDQRQLRDRIDARLLALSRSGGNIEALAGALDLNEKTMDRALARARSAEGA